MVLHAGVGEQCEEEEVAEVMCYEPTTTPILHLAALLRGGGGSRAGNGGVKLSVGRWKVRAWWF